MSIKSLLLASSAVVALSSGAPLAQDANDNTDDFSLEEILVTATKRETALADTSIAVTAFSSEARDRLGILGAQNIADLTPGMTVQDSPNRISMRGVGRLTNALGSDPSVGVYSDGIYTSEITAVSSNTMTVDRIEVLRGPQGTLYGRNTIGGAINTISVRPSEDWQGHLRASLGNYGRRYLGAAISGPVSDKARVRLSASHDENSGYIKNIGYGDNQWANDDYNFEAQLEWDLTENLQVWLKYAHYQYDTTPRETIRTSPHADEVFRGDLIINPSFNSSEVNPSVDDPFTVSMDNSGYLRLDGNHGVTGHITWDFDTVTFKYMGGWNTYDWSTSNDNDRTNQTNNIVLTDPTIFAPVVTPASLENTYAESKEWSSHDLQLMSNGDTGLEWIVGLYYYKEDVFQPYALSQPGNARLLDPRIQTFGLAEPANAFIGFTWTPAAANPDYNYYYQDGQLNSEAYAAYGQASVDVSDTITLTAGLRYSHDKKDGVENQRIIYDPIFYTIEPAVYAALLGGFLPADTNPFGQFSVDSTGGTLNDSHEADWSAVTGMASVEYRPDDDTLWYLNISQGYKSGGFRLGGISDIAETPDVNEAEVGKEEILAFELGYKSTFHDKFQLNTAAYFYDYKGLQSEVEVRRFGVNLTELFNAGKSEIYGLELEATWQAGPYTQFIASYAYSHSEYKDFCGDRATSNPDGSIGCLVNPLAEAGETNLVDPTGNTLNKAPKHKLAAVANHIIPMDSGSLSLTATFAYVGAQQYSVFNHDESRVGGYSRTDGRISWLDNEDRYQIHGYVRNAFDNLSATGSGSGGAPFYYTAQSFNLPRTFGIELQLNF